MGELCAAALFALFFSLSEHRMVHLLRGGELHPINLHEQ